MSDPACVVCRQPLVKRPKESPLALSRRRTCGMRCRVVNGMASSHNTSRLLMPTEEEYRAFVALCCGPELEMYEAVLGLEPFGGL